jgi:hypothetical protein
MTKLLESIVSFLQIRNYRKYKKCFYRPRETQYESLKSILKNTESSKIRKKLNINNIKSVEDFRTQCPVTNFEDYDSSIRHLYELKNEEFVMSRAPSEYFVSTSGTTQSPKHFPMNKLFRKEYQKIVMAWVGGIRINYPESFSGKVLFLADVSLSGFSKTEVPCGLFSGHNFRHMPENLKNRYYCIHEDFFELNSSDNRNITLLAHALSADVTQISTIIPETLLNFVNGIFRYGKDVLKYMENGEPPFNEEVSRQNSFTLKSSPESIKRVKSVLENGSIKSLHDLFPRLKTLNCWTSSSANYYFQRLKNLIPRDVIVWESMYSACEGLFNLPDRPFSSDGPVAISGHFLEFSHVDDSTQKLLLADELVMGEKYEIYVTSSMGLFRYRMNDIVKVTGFTNNTPRIVFVEKNGLFLGLAQERVTPEHVNLMMNSYIEQHSLNPSDIVYFTLCLNTAKEKAHYSLLVETNGIRHNWQHDQFTSILSEINPNFARAVKSGGVGGVYVSDLPKGYIALTLKEREKEGLSIAQFKFSPIEKGDGLVQKYCQSN